MERVKNLRQNGESQKRGYADHGTKASLVATRRRGSSAEKGERVWGEGEPPGFHCREKGRFTRTNLGKGGKSECSVLTLKIMKAMGRGIHLSFPYTGSRMLAMRMKMEEELLEARIEGLEEGIGGNSRPGKKGAHFHQQ